MFSEHLSEFAGKPVVDFDPDGDLPDPATQIPRLGVDWESDHSATDLLTQLLQKPGADQLTGIVVGPWVGELTDANPGEILEALVTAAGQLPHITAIFLGDIVVEESEVSWIQQTDVSPLWSAYPRLEHFGVRGGEGLSLGTLVHDHLQSLVVECGGLPKSVLAEIAAAKLPELTHLEIYLGTSEYTWDGEIDDVRPLLAAGLFPKLTYLGLRDSEIADEVARAVCESPILESIEVLDLSLGTLGDAGGEVLLNTPAITKLKKLDLHYHFMSEAVARRLEALPIEVDVSDRQIEEDYGRYVSVSE